MIVAIKYGLLGVGLVLLFIHICLDLFYYTDRYEQKLHHEHNHRSKGRKFIHTPEELSLIDNVLIEPNLCHDEMSPKLLIAIKSDPTEIVQRTAIRMSWLTLAKNYSVEHVFVLGTQPDGSIRKDVLKENSRFADLIVGDFDDDFYNLTLKSLLTLNWTANHCPNRWLLYVEDNTIVNVDNVLKFITNASSDSRSTIYCSPKNGDETMVDRYEKSPTYVSKHTYSNDIFPSFCRNFGALFGPDSLLKLVNVTLESKSIPKLDLDSILITGLVAQAAFIPRLEGDFKCCADYGRKEYLANMVLGKQGKGVMLVKQWQEMIAL